MRSYYFFLFSVVTLFLGVQGFSDVVQDARLAQSFYEANDFSQALDLYEKMLGTNVADWQKADILYNIATVFLAEGMAEEAEKRFHSIVFPEKISPLFLQRFYTNLALSHLEETDNDTKPSLQEYQNKLSLFKQAMHEITKAEKYACAQNLLEGTAACTTPFNLAEIHLAIKQRQAQFLLQYSDFRIQNASLSEGISMLLSNIQNFLERLSLFSWKDLPPSLLSRYKEVYLKQEKDWIILWESMQKRLESEKGNEVGKEFFLEAKKDFTHALSLLEKEHFDEAIQDLNKASKALTDLFAQLFGEDSLTVILHQLLNNYLRTLFYYPLQQNDLISLQKEQNLAESKIPDSAKPQFKVAQEDLGKAIEFSDNGKNLDALLYAESARYHIRKITSFLGQRTKNKTEQILKDSIDDQENSLSLLRLKLQWEEQEQVPTEAKKLLESSQSAVLTTSSPFIQEALEEQQQSFKEGQCQHMPWNQVLPLFDKGKRAAEEAARLLQEASPRWEAVKSQQETALKNWKEALKQLKKPKEQKKSEQNQSEENQQEQAKPAEAKAESMNQVLHYLLEMENDDKSKFQWEGSPPSKELRPW